MPAYTIYYMGRVQGVGFRATCQHLARPYHTLSGEVANMAAGGVRLVVQGEEQEIAEYLETIARHFVANVTTVRKEAGASITISPLQTGIRIGRDVW